MSRVKFNIRIKVHSSVWNNTKKEEATNIHTQVAVMRLVENVLFSTRMHTSVFVVPVLCRSLT